jgi:hypothetical protein
MIVEAHAGFRNRSRQANWNERFAMRHRRQRRRDRMPAGRYLVAALHDPDVPDVTAAPVLETVRKQATPVTLVAGQTAKVALRVTSLPR